MRGAISFTTGSLSMSLIPMSLITVLCLISVVGCGSSPWAKNVVSSDPIPFSPGSVESLNLTYRLDAGKMSAPMSFTRVENQLISHQQAASNPVPERSTGTLMIKYPHPAAREGYALVSVLIESDVFKFQPAARDSWWWRFNAGKKEKAKQELMQIEKGTHEAWVLDVPKHEIDEILSQMNQQFATYQQKATGEAELDVRWGKKKQKLRGETLTQLDRLMVRVRGQGQLVSYHRPAVRADQRKVISHNQHAQNFPTGTLPTAQQVSYDRTRLGAKLTGFSAPAPRNVTPHYHVPGNTAPNLEQNVRVVRQPEARVNRQPFTSPYMPSENRWPFSVPTPQLNQEQGTTWR